MSVASFLKKVGLEALKVAQGATTVIPLLQPFAALIPKAGGTVQADLSLAQDKLQTLFNLVQQAEQMFAAASSGASGLGSQKAAAVALYVPALLGQIELLGGARLTSKIKDQAKFNADCQRLAGVVADLMNDCGD